MGGELVAGAGPRDVLSGLLGYRDALGARLPDHEVADNILTLIAAGYDTSCSAASLACKYLAAHPAIMDDIYQENMEIVARKAGGREEPLTWADTQKMKLLWRVVQETMRLSPPVELGFRVMLDDIVFDGFTIPKSWQVMWSAHSTHRNPNYFPDPDKFDPSRFEGSGPPPFTFIPFGGGPRMCPGNEFASMNLLIILHHLITRFSWTPVDPNEPIVVDPLPFPANGLPVLLQPRPKFK